MVGKKEGPRPGHILAVSPMPSHSGPLGLFQLESGNEDATLRNGRGSTWHTRPRPVTANAMTAEHLTAQRPPRSEALLANQRAWAPPGPITPPETDEGLLLPCRLPSWRPLEFQDSA